MDPSADPGLDPFGDHALDPSADHAMDPSADHAMDPMGRSITSLLQSPPESWKITPKLLKYKPREHIGFQAKMKAYLSKQYSILGLILISGLLFLLFALKSSPLQGQAILLYLTFVILLELQEMKFSTFPRFAPADLIYLASLFALPLSQVLELIVLGSFVGAARELKKTGRFTLPLLNELFFITSGRLFLFGLSVLIFKWIGLIEIGKFLKPETSLRGIDLSLYLVAVIEIWAVLYATGGFIFNHLEAMFRRRQRKIAWHWPSLKYSILFETAVVVPCALIVAAFSWVNPVHTPYLFLSFILILILSYPLLDYFRKAIEGNVGTLEALNETVDERFPFYEGHSRKVAALAKMIAIQLRRGDEEIEGLMIACLLSGLGKVQILDDILKKNGKLTGEEMACIEEYPATSAKIASQQEFFRGAVPIIRSHCEWWNGKGYPDHLQAEEIPLGARILTVANAYCAMITDRPYRKALSEKEAVQIIQSGAGGQFDPKVVDAFSAVIALHSQKNNAKKLAA